VRGRGVGEARRSWPGPPNGMGRHRLWRRSLLCWKPVCMRRRPRWTRAAAAPATAATESGWGRRRICREHQRLSVQPQAPAGAAVAAAGVLEGAVRNGGRGGGGGRRGAGVQRQEPAPPVASVATVAATVPHAAPDAAPSSGGITPIWRGWRPRGPQRRVSPPSPPPPSLMAEAAAAAAGAQAETRVGGGPGSTRRQRWSRPAWAEVALAAAWSTRTTRVTTAAASCIAGAGAIGRRRVRRCCHVRAGEVLLLW